RSTLGVRPETLAVVRAADFWYLWALRRFSLGPPWVGAGPCPVRWSALSSALVRRGGLPGFACSVVPRRVRARRVGPCWGRLALAATHRSIRGRSPGDIRFVGLGGGAVAVSGAA